MARRYITRPEAHAEVLSERMPAERTAARRWLDEQERQDRKNARVIDKIITALPRELHPLQRRKLVRVFAERLTQGRAAWLAAIHQAGKDAGNPHAHIVIRDRDPDTGKRVALLSEQGACQRVRLFVGAVRQRGSGSVRKPAEDYPPAVLPGSGQEKPLSASQRPV